MKTSKVQYQRPTPVTIGQPVIASVTLSRYWYATDTRISREVGPDFGRQPINSRSKYDVYRRSHDDTRTTHEDFMKIWFFFKKSLSEGHTKATRWIYDVVLRVRWIRTRTRRRHVTSRCYKTFENSIADRSLLEAEFQYICWNHQNRHQSRETYSLRPPGPLGQWKISLCSFCTQSQYWKDRWPPRAWHPEHHSSVQIATSSITASVVIEHSISSSANSALMVSHTSLMIREMVFGTTLK